MRGAGVLMGKFMVPLWHSLRPAGKPVLLQLLSVTAAEGNACDMPL